MSGTATPGLNHKTERTTPSRQTLEERNALRGMMRLIRMMVPSLYWASISQKRATLTEEGREGGCFYGDGFQSDAEPLPYLLLDLAVLGDHPMCGGCAGPWHQAQQQQKAQDPAQGGTRRLSTTPSGNSFCYYHRHLPQARPYRATRKRNC